MRIIEKQFLGINLTQSEKNRLSRDIRKKFEFIKEASQFKDDFELKKGAEIKKIVEETKAFIINSEYFKNIKRIILFGSSTENQRSFKSDIDIAVEFNKVNQKEAMRFRINIGRGLNEKIDLQVYNVLPEKIKKEINEKGKLLYERKD
ncbi:MAG: nucleotidyltransferase domain-containing protein [Nanoarchaeota archaeon]